MISRSLVPIALLFAVLAGAPAQAQDWLRDPGLAEFGDQQLRALQDEVSRAPERALRELLRDEGKALEQLSEDELRTYGDEAWLRLQAADESGHLFRQYLREFRIFGPIAKRLALQAWGEAKRRLPQLSGPALDAVVEHTLRAALLDRLRAIRDARIEVAHFGDRYEGLRARNAHEDRRGTPRYDDELPFEDSSVSSYGVGTSNREETLLDSSVPLPNLRVSRDRGRFEAALLERSWETKIGELKVTAAKVEGLYEAKLGRVSYTDAYGGRVKGYGTTFRARAKVTGLRTEFSSEELHAEVARDLGLHANLEALTNVSSNADIEATMLANPRGIGVHYRAHAGAGATADVRLPTSIDLKLITIRVVPYARVHAGAAADAHATFEVEWEGKIRVDVGATLSAGTGVGAGVMIEIELGPVVKRALSALIKRLARLGRPIAEFLKGRTWKGPSRDSDAVTLSLADIERADAGRGEAGRSALPTQHAALAARYAPVFYQRVSHGSFDYVRRVDYDGDWDTQNNWNNVETGSKEAHVYYDVRETESHYFLTYSVYHAGRPSDAILGMSSWFKHENDMGGCIVVVNKTATRGREVEVLITANGRSSEVYTGQERRDGEREHWRGRYGHWNGYVRFVDEVDHHAFDVERTHPQVWIDDGDHDVYGFNGRDDKDPFSGRDGVIYYPTGTAESPESDQDDFVGYALRPLSELIDQAENPEVFSADDAWVRDGVSPLPRRLRGNEGPDDHAVPPWAWGDRRHAKRTRGKTRRHSDSGRREWIEEGDLFADPARTLSVWFKTPETFSRTWIDNPFLGVTPSKSGGFVDAVAASQQGLGE